MPAARRLAPLAAALALASCSPRYSLHEVVAPGFEVDGEAYVREEADLTFAYDFWGSEGVPFVAIYNPGEDTVYLDLRRSTIRTSSLNLTLEEALSGGFGGARAIAEAYPRVALVRRPLRAALLPGQWTEFYGLAQVAGPGVVGYGGNRRREESTYDYALVHADGRPASATHVFSDYVSERLRKRAFVAATAATPRPNLYYLDRDPKRVAMALEMSTGFLNLLWVL